MPTLKNRMIFISHAWAYTHHYNKIVEWLDNAPNFSWSNCSVPSHDGLPDKTSIGLAQGMTRQINPAQVVLILGGMYAAHSEWIEYEISEALRLQKIIIGIKPWGQERVPTIVQNASICDMVGWNSTSIIQAIRDYT
ncbi:TIR domain-containing protein [Myxococcota bacterium]|nr:TIR domain-containing protein [Myxococcota bacterium]MBU1381373.1 TIR domain-containing protein [Myxococcota bacterium]MBU1498376.1 TIR domain-containing protein [Myxococcota bacterium]